MNCTKCLVGDQISMVFRCKNNGGDAHFKFLSNNEMNSSNLNNSIVNPVNSNNTIVLNASQHNPESEVFEP